MTFPKSKVILFLCKFLSVPPETPVRTLKLPATYVCVVHSIHPLYIQIVHKISCCCHLNYYNWNSVKIKGSSVTSPNSSTPFVYTHCSLPSRLNQQSRTVHPGATACSTSKNLAYDAPGRYICLWTAIA